MAAGPSRIPWKLVIGAVVLVAGAGAFVAIKKPFGAKATANSASALYRVVPMDLEVMIKQQGELQAVDSVEIVNNVEGTTTILQIAPEGEPVKKGDVLIRLDSSAIEQRVEDTTLELQKAENDVIASRELREIQLSTNSANLEAADVALVLAQLDLKAYIEGNYPKLSADAATALEMAEITLKNKAEDLAQTRALFAKGFVMASDVKKAELEFANARNARDGATSSLKVLTEYTHEMDMASKRNALAQAEQKLARTKRENASNLSQRDADLRAKEQSLDVINKRMERLKEQLAACERRAPEDGLVVYATTGDRNAQNLIQAGAQVRERQALLRLPDTKTMKAVVRLGESQVPRVNRGMKAAVQIMGTPQPQQATVGKISVLADSGQRFWNPDAKEFPTDIILDRTPPGLKPGMGAYVQISIDRAQGALAVPMSAMYSVGRDQYVFRQDGERFVPQKVVVGMSTDTHIQITSGLAEGANVKLLQAGEGRTLLEAAGITVTPEPRENRGNPGGAAAPGGGNRRGNRSQGGPGGPATAPATMPAAS